MDKPESARDVAIKRLKAKRDFKMHLGAYLIVFWGVAVAFHGWSAYFGQPFSESEIRREIGDDS